MATTEFQARTPSTASERRHRAAWWVVALVAALAVAVGFGVGYLIFGQDSTSEGNAEAEAVVDDFVAALNAYDTEALRALATQDAVLADRDLSVTGALGYDTRITEWEAAGYTFETIGEPIVVDISDGLGSEFRVAQACVVKDRDGTEMFRAVYSFLLVRQDGELLVSNEANLDVGLEFWHNMR